MLARERHVGQHVVLAGVHEIGQLGSPRAELFCHLAPGLSGLGAIGLIEGLPDRGGDDGVLTARDMCQGIAHPVDTTALPGGFEHPRDGGPEAGMRVTDHQPNASEAPGLQGAQKLGPEGLGFRGADTEADDLAPPLGVRRDGHDAPAPTDLQVGGVEPDIGPFSGERAVQGLADALVYVLAELGHRALGDAAEPHCLHQIVHAPGRDAPDPGFLDDGDQGLL